MEDLIHGAATCNIGGKIRLCSACLVSVIVMATIEYSR